MFDFENLDVYKKAKIFYSFVGTEVLCLPGLDGPTKNQLRRASLSVVLNIAEGASRFSKADRKNFCVVARGSVFECVAIFDILKDESILSKASFDRLYEMSEEISKMLFAMIKSLQ